MSKKLTTPALMLGSTENCPDIRHATGLVVPDPLVVLAMGGRLALVVSRLEYGRVRRALPRAKVRTPEMLGLSESALRSYGEWALALLREVAVEKVRVATDFPLAAARVLEAGGVVLETVGAGELRPSRVVKTATEIARITASQRAAVAGILRAEEMIRAAEIGSDGVLHLDGDVLTSERVRAAIRETVVKFGCIDSGTIVAGGAQGADPHETGSGPLRASEFIVVDLFPRHLETGYWGDITRTFMRGVPSSRQRAMYAAVRRAQRAALGMVKAGVKGSAVHRAAAESMAADGFVTELHNGLPVGFFHGTGHGVGLELHEAPTLGGSDAKLKAGMVVTVEPGLYYPELGGVRIEDTVVVTKDGCRKLATCPVRGLER